MMEEDPENIHQALKSQNSKKWIEAMNDEIKSIYDNNVWDIILLPEVVKSVGCKWIFKTKQNSKGNVERYKARLIAKDLPKRKA
jgi:Reverse transcriptase (RNA-dependent DNA polymerase)